MRCATSSCPTWRASIAAARTAPRAGWGPRYKCRELGIDAPDEVLQQALRRIKEAELGRDGTFLALVGARPEPVVATA